MLQHLTKLIRRLRTDPAQFDLSPYQGLLEEINAYRLESLEDSALKEMSATLIQKASGETREDDLLVEAYALAREACRRVLGLYPFDVQVIAAIAMHRGKLVEMQTGEGKTLAAVLPVYLNALSGKGVHVITFNDYLAWRDAGWMGPVYRFLGLTVGTVREGMNTEERQRAYSCHITYVTAKEAGFDYLRGFLCVRKEDLVHRPFRYAVIDEADSILIDEARIPLVIAGNISEPEAGAAAMAEIAGSLIPRVDYDVDEYARNIYLTDGGVEKAEALLGCGNLYDAGNLDLLTGLNNALHAGVLLKRDVDYIVRDGKIELVDEFTGRIAEKRHWPDGLQAAIEAKEGLNPETKGKILSSITLQNFIRLYPKICGMTGTARPSDQEFKGFYGMDTVVIPTNRPCIRKDCPDVIFTHREAKQKALVAEIVRVHGTGRPILVGTRSVEESEELAHVLEQSGVGYRVLNAKNDELEAGIIAEAGAPGAVTISTNMAGRGADIKLGGADESRREEVVALGGLYVIGTNRHESLRIDNQLRGRAGRQGDPGETRFFISLEDDLMKRYKIKELIPAALYPPEQDEPVDNPVIRREAARLQRIIEGQNLDIRRTLGQYSHILEKQRRAVHLKRQGVLLKQAPPELLSQRSAERWRRLCSQVGEAVLQEVERKITLYHMNSCWADYLEYISCVRESIHLVHLAGKTPLEEFNNLAVDAFEELLLRIDDEIVKTFDSAEITQDGIDMEKEGLKSPSSTWTYLVNDSAGQLGVVPICKDPVAAAVSLATGGGLLLALGIYNRFLKKRTEVK